MTSSGVSYNFTASFIISSVEIPPFIFEKKYAPVELIPSTYGTRPRAGPVATRKSSSQIFVRITPGITVYFIINHHFENNFAFIESVEIMGIQVGLQGFPAQFGRFDIAAVFQEPNRRFQHFFCDMTGSFCFLFGIAVKRLFQRIRERSDV